MKTILYEPICQESDGSRFWVNGAISSDLDEAISKTKKHTSFKSGAKIIEIDLYEYCDIIDNSRFVKTIKY